MAVDLDARDAAESARELFEFFKSARNGLNELLTDLNSDIYDKLIAVPRQYSELNKKYTEVINLNINARIKAALDDRFGGVYQMQDFANFRNAYESLATLVENNVRHLTPSLNATTKRLEFRSGPDAGQKAAIITQINNVLTNVR